MAHRTEIFHDFGISCVSVENVESLLALDQRGHVTHAA